MTPAHFDVIAKLLRSRDPARAAARLVLIDGKSGVAAAAELGISANSVSRAALRFKAADRDIRAAYKLKAPAK